MKKTLLLLLSLITLTSTAQKDTLKTSLQIGVMGQWQKGNLEQLSVMPNGTLKLYNKKVYTELSANYNYLLLGEFNPVNDFWLSGIAQLKPYQRFFPAIQLVNGFARSYRIDQSNFNSIGGGINLINNQPNKYLQFHVTAGYLHFKFAGVAPHSTFALGTSLRSSFPLSEQVNLNWSFSTYHSGTDTEFWGGEHLLKLNVMLSKNLFLNVLHQTYYQNKEIPDTKKTTAILQFGISYKH